MFEALLALAVLSAVVIGLLTLQGRIFAQTQAAQISWLLAVETEALLSGMRANALFVGAEPNWRHYQAESFCGMGSKNTVRHQLSHQEMATQQWCQWAERVGQRLPRADFSSMVCRQGTMSIIKPESDASTMQLGCPVSVGAQGWTLHVAWRIEGIVYMRAFRLSHV